MMVDHMRPDSTNVINTVFVEQRALNSQPAQQANIMSIPRTIEMEMADGDWRASDQLRKPILISQVPWKASDAYGTNIATFDFPDVLTTIDSIVSRTLSMYAMFRMTPVFRFQINGTKFHQGQMIMSFDPFSQCCEISDIPRTSVTNSPAFNRYYATGLPNVKIMASASDPVELEIPFVHPRNFFTTNSDKGFDILGKVRATVLNPLLFAEGASPQLTLTTWLYAREATVHVPIYYHDLKIPNFKYNSNIEVTSNIMDSVTNLISKGSNIVGNIATGQIGKALRTGQGVIDDLGNLFGFDYPTRPITSEKCISPLEPFAHGKGVSRAIRLALDPVSHHPTGVEEGSVASDPMDIMQIVRTPMLYQTIEWSTTANAGDMLWNNTVYPTAFSSETLASIGGYNYQQPTFLYSLTDKFKFWRGGITVDIEVVATDFHSGKLLVGFVPNAIAKAPTYQQVNSSCPSVVVDIQQASSTSFTIPYVSPTPLKYSSFDIRDDTCLGYMYIFVQNPLVAASNVNAAVQINLYARAADDYQLFVPKASALNRTIGAQSSSAIEVTSDVKLLTNTKTDEQPQASMAFGMDTIAPRPRFGENYSLIDIIRRYDMIGSFILQGRNRNDTAAYATADYIDVSPVHFTDPSINQVPLRTKLAEYADYFAAWSGSIRYKVITSEPRTSQKHLTLVHYPSSSTNEVRSFEEGGSGYAQIRTNLAQDNALEVELPYYTPYNILLTRQPFVDAASNELYEPITNGVLQMVVGKSGAEFTDDDKTTNIQIYHAAGEDFRFYYLRPPMLVTDYKSPVSLVNFPTSISRATVM